MPSLGDMRLRAFVASVAFAAALSACHGERFANCSAAECSPSGETLSETETRTSSVVDLPSLDDETQAGTDSTFSEETGQAPSATTAPNETVLEPERTIDEGSLGSSQPAQPIPSTESGKSESTSEAVATSSELATTATPTPIFGDSLITNGDFSRGNEHWTVDRPSGPGIVSPDYSDERLCVNARTQAQFLVGWPEDPSDALSLDAGSYRLSFRVRGPGAHLHVKVGHAYEPYNTWFESEWTGGESGWQEVSHDFTFTGDDAVGLAFTLELDGSSICLDDVSLQPLLTPAP